MFATVFPEEGAGVSAELAIGVLCRALEDSFEVLELGLVSVLSVGASVVARLSESLGESLGELFSVLSPLLGESRVDGDTNIAFVSGDFGRHAGIHLRKSSASDLGEAASFGGVRDDLGLVALLAGESHRGDAGSDEVSADHYLFVSLLIKIYGKAAAFYTLD